MTTLARGRVLRGAAAADAPTAPVLSTSARPEPHPRGTRAPREVVTAREAAARILADAEARASEIVAAAERAADGARAAAEARGAADGEARLAAAWARLASEEAARDEAALGRTIELARALAERLVHAAIELDAGVVHGLARQALAQVRGARRVTLVAHPDDARALAADLGALGLDAAAVEIQADPDRARGSLRVRTDRAHLDADLAPQLDRLAAVLRDELARR